MSKTQDLGIKTVTGGRKGLRSLCYDPKYNKVRMYEVIYF